MQYAFQVTAESKQEALKRVGEEFAVVAAARAIHANDRDMIGAAASGMLDCLTDDEERNVTIAISGAAIEDDGGESRLSVSLSINAHLTPRAES
jgi:hypothetical protein